MGKSNQYVEDLLKFSKTCNKERKTDTHISNVFDLTHENRGKNIITHCSKNYSQTQINHAKMKNNSNLIFGDDITFCDTPSNNFIKKSD